MEAISFQHYLTTANIISFQDAATQLRKTDPNGPGIELSPEDYILGIFDMTGELMRFAITTMATSGGLRPARISAEDEGDLTSGAGGHHSVLNDMRALRSALEALDAGFGPFAKDVEKKMGVMKSSVEKVERSLYGLTVRGRLLSGWMVCSYEVVADFVCLGAERPKGWMPETESAGRAIEVDR